MSFFAAEKQANLYGARERELGERPSESPA